MIYGGRNLAAASLLGCRPLVGLAAARRRFAVGRGRRRGRIAGAEQWGKRSPEEAVEGKEEAAPRVAGVCLARRRRRGFKSRPIYKFHLSDT